MIELTDDNNSGFIEFEEFATIWQRKLLSTNESYIHKVFSILDTDNNGQIDPEELAEVLDLTNEGDEVKIQEIIKEVDRNDDGKINFDEFRSAMVERNDFSEKAADVGFKLNEEEIEQTEKEYVDIDEADV